MASDLLELTVDIVVAHASTSEMSPDELLNEIKMVYVTLKNIEHDDATKEIAETEMPEKTQNTAAGDAKPLAPVLSVEEAFKPDQVACMICGKSGMTTLKRHLMSAHNMKPGEYRKAYQIPKDQPLAATEYVAKRRQMALDRGLGENLAKARAARKAKTSEA